MSKGQYKKFVCIEPSNQADSFVRLQPQEKHTISMAIQVRSLTDYHGPAGQADIC